MQTEAQGDTAAGSATEQLTEGAGSAITGGTLGLPGQAISTVNTAGQAAEFTGEQLADDGMAGAEDSAAAAGSTALTAGAQAAQAARENPARVTGNLLGGAALAVGGGIALQRFGTAVRDRVRTAGGAEIDLEDTTTDAVAEGRERFPGAENPEPVEMDPAEAVRQQARDQVPDEIQDALESAGATDGTPLFNAMDVEPHGPRRGRAAQGVSAPEADSDLADEFEMAGSSVGPALSPNFLRVEGRADFPLRPGLPDLGGRPTAAVVRTDVENPDARTTAEFDQELRDDAGGTTARAVRDEFEGFDPKAEAEAQLPPGAEFTDAGTGPLRDVARRLGIGSDFFTEVEGRRVPIRTAARPDDLNGGSRTPSDLLRDTRGQAGAGGGGLRVTRSGDELARRGSQPTARTFPDAPFGPTEATTTPPGQAGPTSTGELFGAGGDPTPGVFTGSGGGLFDTRPRDTGRNGESGRTGGRGREGATGRRDSGQPGDDRAAAWKFLAFADSARQYMPARLRDRYLSDGDGGDSDTAPSVGSDVAYNATPVARAAEALTGYVTVTAGVTVVKEPGPETTKAILRDRSGVIDFVTWDSETADRLASLEGETVVVEDTEVGEYDGTRQLQPVDGLTEIRPIQAGVGHTETPDTANNQQLTDTATDGDDTEGVVAQVKQHLSTERDGGTKVTMPDVAPHVDAAPDDVREALERVQERTSLVTPTHDGWRVL